VDKLEEVCEDKLKMKLRGRPKSVIERLEIDTVRRHFRDVFFGQWAQSRVMCSQFEYRK